ncbi:uncharacterized protein GLRG_10823 [Colletotrichum graminicola M1.001]|uniref:Uncharacterized protein n=1 Tax=Colletotrichum graminicola (strain M1.001 / M2 / FGSC 10212) TaxID=645133 RepID=E3QYK6_COLGM|nr:uncharacterized protein GLRG_10823 [Colletotrichum graminicola M1.001]EFQ35944.1 hypothetical protein GLRG_10823 [Colletotrichum graminicola M1.001]
MGLEATVEAQESFPTTQPAFRLTSHFKDKHPCGDVYTGSTLIGVPLLAGGTVKSVGDFQPRCNFTIASSTDYFTVDADKTHGRIDAQAILVDEEGRAVRLRIDGVVALNEHTLPLIQNEPNAANSPFGYGVEFLKFETGHEMYKPLESMRFAGSQRFVYLDGVRTGVEVRISRVVSGTGEA